MFRYTWVKMLIPLVLLWVFNLIDALATWYAVNMAGYAQEVNPPMIWAMAHGAWAFFGLKIGIMTGACAYFYWRGVSKPVAWACCIVFALIDVWHVFVYILSRYL